MYKEEAFTLPRGSTLYTYSAFLSLGNTGVCYPCLLSYNVSLRCVQDKYLPCYDELGLNERESVRCVINTVMRRQRPALGECLAAFSGAFPVAFLEPHLNKYNSFSIYNTKGSRERTGESRRSAHHRPTTVCTFPRGRHV